MREIKFRAFDKKGRFDIAGVEIIDWNDKYVIVDQTWNEDKETGEAECLANFDEIELMQFTGLKDNNGKDIYEGDIVVCLSPHDGDEYIWSNFKGIPFLVSWDDKYKQFDTSGNLVNSPGNFEVIGNIYENPELINPGK